MPNIPPPVRTSFNPVSNRYLDNVSGDRRQVALAIVKKAETVRIRAGEHYEKHRKTWVDREYNDLVKAKGSAPELKPKDAPPRDLSREAAQNVHKRHGARMARIMVTERGMIQSLDRCKDRGR